MDAALLVVGIVAGLVAGLGFGLGFGIPSGMPAGLMEEPNRPAEGLPRLARSVHARRPDLAAAFPHPLDDAEERDVAVPVVLLQDRERDPALG